MKKIIVSLIGLFSLSILLNSHLEAQSPQALVNVNQIQWWGAPGCTWILSGSTISTPCISSVSAGVSSIAVNGGSAQTGVVNLVNITRTTHVSSTPSGSCSDAAALEILDTASPNPTLYGCVGGFWVLLGGSGGSSGVASFNARTGAVTLTLLDVATVLGNTTTIAGSIPQYSNTTGQMANSFGIVTTLGNPGSNSNIPTEAAVRSAIGSGGGGNTTSTSLVSGNIPVANGANSIIDSTIPSNTIVTLLGSQTMANKIFSNETIVRLASAGVGLQVDTGSTTGNIQIYAGDNANNGAIIWNNPSGGRDAILGYSSGVLNWGLNVPLKIYANSVNLGSATHTTPAVTGLVSALPATCSVGEVYFATNATAGQNFYFCGATNTWTQQLNSGGGSLPAQSVQSYLKSNGTTASWGDIITGPTGALCAGTGCSGGTPGIVDIVTSVVPTKTGANSFTGQNDFSGTAAGSKAMRELASDPGTCSVGETYLNNSASPYVFKACTSANTWVPVGSSGGSSPILYGPVSQVLTFDFSTCTTGTSQTLATYTIPASTLTVGSQSRLKFDIQQLNTTNYQSAFPNPTLQFGSTGLVLFPNVVSALSTAGSLYIGEGHFSTFTSSSEITSAFTGSVSGFNAAGYSNMANGTEATSSPITVVLKMACGTPTTTMSGQIYVHSSLEVWQ